MHFVLFKSYKFIQDLINIADCLCKEFTEKNNISIEETILTSPIQKLLTHSSKSVTKLTDRKIRWII
ncbi:MAG: hypothetical protein WAM42_16655, partial [Candidatus Nitrosopolaris sp.]